MSTVLAQGDIFNCRHEFDLGSDKAFNILHYQVNSITVTATGLPAAVAIPLGEHAPEIASQMYTHFSNAWKPNAANDVTMRRTTIQSIHPAPRSVAYTYTPVDPDEGFRVSDPLPLQDSATLLKRSAYGQRWGMGRIFFVGIPEGNQDGGKLLAPYVTDVNTSFQLFHNQVTFPSGAYTITMQTGVWRGLSTAVPRFLPLTSVQLSDDVIKTQRRRRPGKGI